MSERSPLPFRYSPDTTPLSLAHDTVQKLHAKHRENPPPIFRRELLTFFGIPGGYSVYNATPVNDTILAGRVAPTDSEKSDIWFFRKDGNQSGNAWVSTGIQIRDTEDFSDTVVTIDGETFHLSHGVKVGEHPEEKYRSAGIKPRNVFWCVKEIEAIPETKPIWHGPPGWKDTTPLQYPRVEGENDGVFGVFPRSQENGSRGEILYNEFRYLEELPRAVETAVAVKGMGRLIDGHIVWGAITDAFPLGENGLVGWVGHLGYYMDEKGAIVEHGPLRGYDVVAGVFDRRNVEIVDFWLELMREDLPYCEPRILPGYHPQNLWPVAFATKLQRLGNEREWIWGGVSDNASFWVETADRFSRWEKAA